MTAQEVDALKVGDQVKNIKTNVEFTVMEVIFDRVRKQYPIEYVLKVNYSGRICDPSFSEWLCDDDWVKL